MTSNVGTIDRIVRIVLGLALIGVPLLGGLALFQSTPILVASVVVGLVLVATASMRFCPMYRVFGIRTCTT